jgi:prepilin-type N-terminal cleavage/methylation domain-containing protein
MTLKISDNKGFTMVELAVALAALAVIVAISFEPGVRLMRWMKETETKEMLFKLQNAVTAVYKSSAWSIDASDTNTFVFNIRGSAYTLTNGSSSDANNRDALRAIASSVSNIPISDADRDSMRNAMQVFVSNRLVGAASGINYHVVAVVSPGWDGILDSSFNAATGALTLQKDDMGIVVSGFKTQQDNITETNKKLANIRDAYQNYFTSLYLNDASRSIYKDRFARRNNSCGASQFWDAGSLVDNSNCVNNTASSIGLKTAIGASQDAVTTAWWREMRVDNSSTDTRNPDNTGNTPPYTARVLAELPWGGYLDATVTGQY